MSDLTSSTSEFAEAARAYCAWCESMDPERSDSSAACLLGQLYSSALLLPSVEPENDDCLPDLSAAELSSAKSNLESFAGRYYRQVFNPDPLLDEEVCMGDLGDDLLDIYKDIRGGLLLYERGEINEALWHWRFLHKIHWGHHAVSALYALHCLSVSQHR